MIGDMLERTSWVEWEHEKNTQEKQKKIIVVVEKRIEKGRCNVGIKTVKSYTNGGGQWGQNDRKNGRYNWRKRAIKKKKHCDKEMEGMKQKPGKEELEYTCIPYSTEGWNKWLWKRYTFWSFSAPAFHTHGLWKRKMVFLGGHKFTQ